MKAVFAAKPIKPLEPGSAEWLQKISASKIPTILGIGPTSHGSKFDLWHKMRGSIGHTETDTDDTLKIGHFLELAVAAWWKAKNPGWKMLAGGTWQSKSDPRFICTPDRRAYRTNEDGSATWRILEFKSARDSDEWGTEGTAEVPIGYLSQVAWQIFILGVDEVEVTVITSFFDFKTYVVRRQDIESDLPAIIEAVEWFLLSLETGQEPEVDGRPATLRALKKINPLIEAGDGVELPHELAYGYAVNKRARKAAEEADALTTAQVMKAMGNAQKAYCGSITVAGRQPSYGNVKLVQARGLNPDLIGAPTQEAY